MKIEKENSISKLVDTDTAMIAKQIRSILQNSKNTNNAVETIMNLYYGFKEVEHLNTVNMLSSIIHYSENEIIDKIEYHHRLSKKYKELKQHKGKTNIDNDIINRFKSLYL